MANIFGIDSGAHAVKVAMMEKRFRSLETVKLIRRLTRSLGDEEAPEIAAQILTENGYDADEDYVALIYPADRLTWRRIRVPFKENHLIREALVFEVESHTPFDADEVVCDFSVFSSNDKGADIIAAVALKRDFEPFLKGYKEAGIDPDAVIPAPSLFEETPIEMERAAGTVLTLDIGYQKTVITILSDGALAGFHGSGLGLDEVFKAVGGGDEEKFERLFSDQSFAGEEESHAFTLALTAFARKIASENENLASTALPSKMWPPEDGVCVLTGGGALSEPLQRSICDAVGLPLALIDHEGYLAPIDDDRLSFRNAKPELFTGALLSASRMVKGEGRPALNFVSGAYAKKRRLSGRGAQVAIASVMLALVAITSLASYGMEIARLNGRYTSIKKEIRAEFSRALPEVTTIVSEPIQLRNALAELERNQLLAGGGPDDADPFLERLRDITTAKPEGVTLDVDRLVYEGGNIRIIGKTSSFDSVEQLKKGFARLPWTERVTVSDAKTTVTRDGVGFTIIMETAL